MATRFFCRSTQTTGRKPGSITPQPIFYIRFCVRSSAPTCAKPDLWWLLIGSVPGVLIGGRFTVKLPDRALRIALAATLTLAGIKLVDPPGSDGILVAGAATAAIGALYATARWLAGRGTVVATDPD